MSGGTLCEEFWFRKPVLAVCSIAIALGGPFMFGVYYEDDVIFIGVVLFGSIFTLVAFVTMVALALDYNVQNWRQAYAIGVWGNTAVALLFHGLGSIVIHVVRPSARVPSWSTYCAGVVVCAAIAVACFVVWLMARCMYYRAPLYTAQPLPHIPGTQTHKVKTPV